MGDIRVIMAGATGKTGSAVAAALLAEPGIQLVGAVGPHHGGQDLGLALGGVANGIEIQTDLASLLDRTGADVLVDFTTPQVAARHAQLALEHGLRPVVGTTGLKDEQLADLTRLAEEKQLALAVIPNFSFGVMLLSKFAVMAVQYFPQVEVVETHHHTKLDAPSGTALRIVNRLEAGGANAPVPVHSLRLPGFVAHHEIVFGGMGEALTIRHDTFNRSSFGPGVILAVRNIGHRRGIIRTLEEFLPGE